MECARDIVPRAGRGSVDRLKIKTWVRLREHRAGSRGSLREAGQVLEGGGSGVHKGIAEARFFSFGVLQGFAGDAGTGAVASAGRRVRGRVPHL